MQVAYPNFGILNSKGDKSVLFHHGHFLEDIYTLMSTVKTYIFPNQSIPEDIWDIEKKILHGLIFFGQLWDAPVK